MSDRLMYGTAMLLLLSGWVPVLGGQAAERPAQTADKSDAANAKQVAGAAPSSDATAYKQRVGTRLVLVPALVNDSKGNVVSGLKASDFTIEDNGKAQRVKFIEEIVAAPAEELAKTQLPPETFSNSVVTPKAPLRVVIILFDMLNSHFKDQVPARVQLTKYLRTQIAPGTMVALLGLGRGGLRMYHDLTSDTQGLGTELEMAMNSGRHSISTNLQDEMSGTEANEAFVGHGVFAETGSTSSTSCSRLRAARDFASALFERRSDFVPTTRYGRWVCLKKSMSTLSLGCGGMLVSTRQMPSASVSRSARYGSIKVGHSEEMDFEILA